MFLRGFRRSDRRSPIVIVGVYLVLNADRDRQRAGLPGRRIPSGSTTGTQLVLVAATGTSSTRAAAGSRSSRPACCSFPSWRWACRGFETGVAVMPLVKGDPDDDPHKPAGPDSQHAEAAAPRRRSSCRCCCLGSSAGHGDADRPAGADHRRRGRRTGRWRTWPTATRSAKINPLFGETFGTIYDISTVVDPLVRRRERHGGAA